MFYDVSEHLANLAQGVDWLADTAREGSDEKTACRWCTNTTQTRRCNQGFS